MLSMADYAAGELWRLESVSGRGSGSTSSSSAAASGGVWRNLPPGAVDGLSHGLTAFIISVLEGGIALHLSPADVNVAVGIVERLALQAPPASLGYGSNGGGSNPSSRALVGWPSTPVPDLEDASFGLTGPVVGSLRESMNQHFGTSTVGATIRSDMMHRLGAGGVGSHFAAGKPALCLVAGDALGARLLGWCTVFCRSPQWRGLFSEAGGGGVLRPLSPPRAGGSSGEEAGATGVVSGKKRTAEDMEAAGEEGSGGAKDGGAPTPPPSAKKASGTDGSSSGEGREGDRPAGLARLLCVVSQVVRIVKEHTKVAQDKAGAVGFFAGPSVGGGGPRGVPVFDVRTRESSGLAQAAVGALADAALDVFADHMEDPALHGRLRREARVTGEDAAAAAGEEGSAGLGRGRGAAMAISDLFPLVDSTSPAETVGLSVDLIGDIAWLFSSLEPETEAGTGGRGGTAASKAGPAAAQLSSAMSCWASGRVLACMPGREHLEYALGLPSSSAAGGSEEPVVQATGPPLVRPLPARLACFAVRNLLDNVQVAREKDCESGAAEPPP
ncbi:unnamed protein product, partial [Ectocarpus sp. 12 AP-2014]